MIAVCNKSEDIVLQIKVYQPFALYPRHLKISDSSPWRCHFTIKIFEFGHHTMGYPLSSVIICQFHQACSVYSDSLSEPISIRAETVQAFWSDQYRTKRVLILECGQ
ncbi:unnamed protein product [Somion occarium]|uniref:Uncharacterized protein n=1 Tax=Somion occarium TaxID=3059160 RepID=A0ABP1D950_9APHY